MAQQHKGVAGETSDAMARWFRPVAPKPMPSPPPVMPAGALRRSRKRSREDYRVPSPVSKRDQRDVMYYPLPLVQRTDGDGKTPIVTRGWRMHEMFSPRCEDHLGRLSFGGSPPSPWAPSPYTRWLFPIERDLVSKLQAVKVIKPHPSRLIHTTITINSGNCAGAGATNMAAVVSKKTVRRVEAELELPDALPAIVSGHDNSCVHLANDAYKAMVGQPVCPWLDSLRGTGTSRRINGEVALDVHAFNTSSYLPSNEGAFPCTARISWERADAVASLTVPCAVERLTGKCNSVDYCFIWRFDSRRASIIYEIA